MKITQRQLNHLKYLLETMENHEDYPWNIVVDREDIEALGAAVRALTSAPECATLEPHSTTEP